MDLNEIKCFIGSIANSDKTVPGNTRTETTKNDNLTTDSDNLPESDNSYHENLDVQINQIQSVPPQILTVYYKNMYLMILYKTRAALYHAAG